MSLRTYLPAVCLAACLSAVAAPPLHAQDDASYRVTITNLTRAQRFTPVLVATHTTDTRVFAPGSPASAEVRAMAEEGNDAFVGLNSVPLPTGFDPMVIDAVAYDAGTERNDERCSSIPGPGFPECNGPGGGARAGGGEGAVTVHNGMHGVGDFRASERDWRNPVARVTIQRLR